MRMAVLGSGSGGNATLVQCGQTRLLVDAGLSAKQLTLRMESLGVDPDSLDAILLTHEHGDHTRGLDVMLRKRQIPVYTNALTREALSWGMKSQVRWRVFQTGQSFQVGDMDVYAFPVPHDAAEPVAFVLEAEETRLGMVTDVGFVTQGMLQHLKSLDALFVEANYDERLLEEDTKRPWGTKQRIASRHGHLSNTQSSELIGGIVCERLSEVVLCHLSSDCNTDAIACQAVNGVLGSLGHGHVNVRCAGQDVTTGWIDFGKRPNPLEALKGDLVQGDLGL